MPSAFTREYYTIAGMDKSHYADRLYNSLVSSQDATEAVSIKNETAVLM